MRTNGTKYPRIEKLPQRAIAVSQYAHDTQVQVGQVYIKYERFTKGYKSGTKGPDPGYTIRCWQGMNFVIPQ